MVEVKAKPPGADARPGIGWHERADEIAGELYRERVKLQTLARLANRCRTELDFARADIAWRDANPVRALIRALGAKVRRAFGRAPAKVAA